MRRRTIQRENCQSIRVRHKKGLCHTGDNVNATKKGAIFKQEVLDGINSDPPISNEQNSDKERKRKEGTYFTSRAADQGFPKKKGVGGKRREKKPGNRKVRKYCNKKVRVPSNGVGRDLEAITLETFEPEKGE